ncbi:uncharacterized protein LOC131596810 [Vicia villosa]|uniref:uncharacterized protein LOC131596810 n=1 Tax=Vicia villosa TaxID=3911 RepID=UPI00273B7BE6|nr:uncharacterized protein LOC131596810 [Vicia villosa]
MVAGRNGDINVEAVMRWTSAIGQAPHESDGNGRKDEFRVFGDFRKCNPLIFEGKYGPDKAQAWMRDIEKLFQVMNCTDVQKVRCAWKERNEVLKLKRGRGQSSGKPYDDKREQSDFGKKLSGGGTSTLLKCFGCGIEGHHAVDCDRTHVTCFKCNKIGHKAHKCRIGSSEIYYNCGERGHISTKCDNPKKERAEGKGIALSGAEIMAKDELI